MMVGLLKALETQVAVGDWAMVPLEEKWARWFLILEVRATSWAGEFDVFVSQLAIVKDAQHFCIGDFLAGAVEAGSLKGDVKGLPFARWFAGVDAWGVPFDIFLLNPARVNTAALNTGIGILLDAKAVINLNLISALQIHARVGVFGDAKLHVQVDVAKLTFGNQVNCAAFRAIDDNSRAVRNREDLRA